MTAQYAFESVIQHLISPLQSLNRSGGYEALAWYQRTIPARLAADGMSVDAVKRKMGPWTEEENEELVRLHHEYDGDFNAIAMEMGDPSSKHWRSPGQCRLHWSYTLDPSIKKGDWTKEEDAKLKALVKEHGTTGYGAWSKIASEMGGRTDQQCRKHWKGVLCPKRKPEPKPAGAEKLAEMAKSDPFAVMAMAMNIPGWKIQSHQGFTFTSPDGSYTTTSPKEAQRVHVEQFHAAVNEKK